MTWPRPSDHLSVELLTVEPRPVAGRLALVFEWGLRTIGGAVAAVAATLTAIVELLLATVRVGDHLIGVSVLIAVAANIALSWFVVRAIGARWAVALPAVTWFAVMVLAAGGTTEGDILLAGNNWVGFATIFAGSIAFAVCAARMIIAQPSGQR